MQGWRKVAALVGGALGAATVGAVPSGPPAAAGGAPDVTNGNDSGPGSYRQAVLDANGASGPVVIGFAPGLRVELASDVVYTNTEPLTLAANGSTIDGNGAHQVLGAVDATAVTVDELVAVDGEAELGGAIRTEGALTVRDSTFEGNRGTTNGGAIQVLSAPVVVERSTFADNDGGNEGGAIRAFNADHTITDSTFSGNEAFSGGALRSENGSYDLQNVTLSGNRASSDGGGIVTFLGDLTLNHVTMVDNQATTGSHWKGRSVGAQVEAFATVAGPAVGSTPCDTDGTVTSLGHNVDSGDTCGFGAGAGDLVDVGDPGLRDLEDNGAIGRAQTMRTHRPEAGSPLLDAVPAPAVGASAGTCPAEDQRGVGRPVDGDGTIGAACDIGAVEARVEAFSDVRESHPFFEEIGFMDGEGISTGFGDGTYRPAIPVSRQAMSAFMFRLAGEPPFVAPGVPTFGDTPTDHPFYDEIEWMADEGISTGFGDGTYRPAVAVSRQAMSAFMQRLANGPGVGI